MKLERQKILLAIVLGLLASGMYFILATGWRLPVPRDIDYYNPLAQSLKKGRLDIDPPGYTQDLSFYKGKWYVMYGPLPAVVLVLLHLVLGVSFVPLLWLTVFGAGVGVGMVYLVIDRALTLFGWKKSLLPLILAVGVGFGSSLFWVARRPGLWFVPQTWSFTLTLLGLYPLLTDKRTLGDYKRSCFWNGINLLVRPIVVVQLVLPLWLWFWDKKLVNPGNFFRVMLFPGLIFIIFATYNWLRFGNFWEYGYGYHQYHEHHEVRVREMGGWFNFRNIPINLGYMVWEIPHISRLGTVVGNSEGASMFFLTPLFLSIFLALPGRKLKDEESRWRWGLWLVLLLTLLPILLQSSAGWWQFGFRYSLDFMAPMLILVVLGLKGKVNNLVLLSLVFSVWIWTRDVVLF